MPLISNTPIQEEIVYTLRDLYDLNKPLVFRLDGCSAICTQAFYNQFGYLLHPAYNGVSKVWPLIELWELAEANDCLMEVEREVDMPVPLLHDEGRKIYEYRRAKGFAPWAYPPRAWSLRPKEQLPRTYENYTDRHARSYEHRRASIGKVANRQDLLTVLIPTMPSRKKALWWLRKELERQGANIIINDDVHITVGAKRNLLVKQVETPYFIFVDDDDWISADYISSLNEAILANPEVEVISFMVKIWLDQRKKPILGMHGTEFNFSADWDKNNLDFKPPTHIMCWRKGTVKHIKFPEMNCSEDRKWVDETLKISDLLEVKLHKVLYFYEFLKSNTETQNHRKPA